MFSRTPSWLRVILLFFGIFALIEFLVESGDNYAFITYPSIMLILGLVLLILIAMELVLSSYENLMFQSLSPEAKERYLAIKNAPLKWKFGQRIMNKLTRSKSIEQESEIILDHNYDGIRELDNVLPPWWVGLFYATIIFGIVYLVRFHVLNEYTQAEEYEVEVAEARIAVEAYRRTAKNLVDVNTVELLTDASDLNAGKNIFTTNCVACHMADGGGGIGPNLTDDYWILGGDIKSVFSTISEGGRDGKGMVAWKTLLKPVEMAQVASYLLTEFPGTTPANPKDPEGELLINSEAEQQITKVDSLVTMVKSDSVPTQNVTTQVVDSIK